MSEGWQTLGAHTFRIELPDIYFLRICGKISGPDMVQIFESFDHFALDRWYAFWLIDVSRMAGMTPEGRKLAADQPLNPKNRGMAMIGARLPQRVITTLLVRATELLKGDVPLLVFCDTEVTARAWLDDRRRQVSKQPF